MLNLFYIFKNNNNPPKEFSGTNTCFILTQAEKDDVIKAKYWAVKDA